MHPVAHDPERALDTRMARERGREGQRGTERNRVPGESTPLPLAPQRERREQREHQRQPGSNEPDPAEPRIDHVSEEGRPEGRAETESARLRPLEADACDRDDREQQPGHGQHGPERAAYRRGLRFQHPGEDDRATGTEQDEREAQESDHAEHEVDVLRSRLPGQHLLDHSGAARTRLPDGKDERSVYRV